MFSKPSTHLKKKPRASFFHTAQHHPVPDFAALVSLHRNTTFLEDVGVILDLIY